MSNTGILVTFVHQDQQDLPLRGEMGHSILKTYKVIESGKEYHAAVTTHWYTPQNIIDMVAWLDDNNYDDVFVTYCTINEDHTLNKLHDQHQGLIPFGDHLTNLALLFQDKNDILVMELAYNPDDWKQVGSDKLFL